MQCNINVKFGNLQYSEHALEEGSHSRAAAYVGITDALDHRVWAVGVDNDIMRASVKALVGAINKLLTGTHSFGDD